MRAVCSITESEDTQFLLHSSYLLCGSDCTPKCKARYALEMSVWVVLTSIPDGHGRVQSEFFHQRSFKLMEVTLAKVKVLMEGREWAQATLLF